MSLPQIVSREEWLAARRELLADEKAMTRARDALNTRRRELPMVRIDKDYVFEGPDGKASLIDLFEGRRQLIIQHFMFDPSWDEGCPSCSAGADEISRGLLEHLHARDTTLAVVSRAPLAKIGRYKKSRGWTFPWYSSFGTDFNYYFHVTIDASVAPIMWNYRTMDELEQHGMGWMAEGTSEQPATACSCAKATTSSTRTPCTHAAPRCSAGRTTSSTSRRWAGRRTGRNRRAARRTHAARFRTSRRSGRIDALG